MKKVHAVLAVCLAVCLTCSAALQVRAEEEYVTDMLQEIVVPAGSEYVVIDVLDGVEARYRTAAEPDITGDYSCAGFIKNYYQAVYGVQVQNLTDRGPIEPADMFTQVTTPQKGDIIFYPSPPNQNNHSAIVKTFDGEQIVLIEQNFKWSQSGGTYTYINRSVPFPPDGQNAYEIWRLLFIPNEPGTGNSPAGQDGLPAGQQPTPQPEPTPTATPTPTPGAEVSEPPAPAFEATVMIGRMSITVNGTDIPVEAPALIENNRTIMPVRYISLAMGLSPENLVWNGADQTATIYNNADVIQFKIGYDTMYVNGQPVKMNCPAMLKPGGFSYLPVAYLAAALGVEYSWADYGEFNKGVTFYKQ